MIRSYSNLGTLFTASAIALLAAACVGTVIPDGTPPVWSIGPPVSPGPAPVPPPSPPICGYPDIAVCAVAVCACPFCPANADCFCECPEQPACPPVTTPPCWEPPPPPYGYSYTTVVQVDVARHHVVQPADGASEKIQFAWHDAAGFAPPADLSVEANGQPVLQVSSVDGRPFVRAGLDVVPLTADASYRFVLSGHGGSVDVALVDASDVVLVRATTAAPSVDVVLPGRLSRRSIVSEMR